VPYPLDWQELLLSPEGPSLNLAFAIYGAEVLHLFVTNIGINMTVVLINKLLFVIQILLTVILEVITTQGTCEAAGCTWWADRSRCVNVSKTVLDLTKSRIELRLQFTTLQDIAFEIPSIPL